MSSAAKNRAPDIEKFAALMRLSRTWLPLLAGEIQQERYSAAA
jgi:hypothetical protein